MYFAKIAVPHVVRVVYELPLTRLAHHHFIYFFFYFHQKHVQYLLLLLQLRLLVLLMDRIHQE